LTPKDLDLLEIRESAMRIIVCIKQVPDIAEIEKVRVDRASGSLLREGAPSIVNPFDEYAVEEALRLVEKNGGEVIAITMGPPQAEEALLHCLAMGADKAILISDKVFAGSDTLATSYTLALAIKKIADFDIVLCGQKAIDGETGQVGPGVAENLHIPQITYVNKVQVEAAMVKAWRETELGQERVEAKLPVLLTLSKGLNEPRVPTYRNIAEAMEKDIPIWSADELGGDKFKFGAEGSATKVVRTWKHLSRKRGQSLKGEPLELARMLTNILKEKGFV
jgi:electron transfer flavoprotein beta subunit